MILTVWVAAWQLEEDRRVLAVGDEVTSWLTFNEQVRWPVPAEQVQVVRGIATPLASWPGSELGREPVRIDVDGAALYWDAPEPVAGAVEVAGRVSTNNVDAPDDFPETSGVVRRVRMEWQDFVMAPSGSWVSEEAGLRYEEVSASYIPRTEEPTLDLGADRAASRRARRAYSRQVSLWRRRRGSSLHFAAYGLHTTPESPPGTKRSDWTGVLIDLETAASLHE